MKLVIHFLTGEIEVTIGFVEESYTVVEGEGGVTLEVGVIESNIRFGHLNICALATTDQSANGVIHLYRI